MGSKYKNKYLRISRKPFQYEQKGLLSGPATWEDRVGIGNPLRAAESMNRLTHGRDGTMCHEDSVLCTDPSSSGYL